MSSWSQGTASADQLGVDRVPKGCDTTDSDRALEQRAICPLEAIAASAAHRDRRWASRTSSLRRSRQPSGSATGTGAVLAGLVDERAAGDVRGAGALLCDIAGKQYCRSLWQTRMGPFWVGGGVALAVNCGAALQIPFEGTCCGRLSCWQWGRPPKQVKENFLLKKHRSLAPSLRCAPTPAVHQWGSPPLPAAKPPTARFYHSAPLRS